MKSVLLALWMTLFSVVAFAQDFATRFMAEHQQDANLSCITISPTMMNKILKSDAAEKDEQMAEMISNLKSMQLLTSKTRVQRYYREALKVIDKNSDRFEPYLSFKGKLEECKMMVRRRKGTIIEMVMLTKNKHQFSVINLTGIMSDDFISQLAGALKQKHS
jgi:hypothetical protein